MSGTDSHQPDHEPVPFAAVPAETVAQWEPGTFVENLAPAPDGGWFVTLPSHRRVDHVAVSDRRTTVAQLATMPTGIVADGEAGPDLQPAVTAEPDRLPCNGRQSAQLRTFPAQCSCDQGHESTHSHR